MTEQNTLKKYDWLFALIGKLATALVLILAFLLICSFVSHQAVNASDRYDQGQHDMIEQHKLENKGCCGG